MSKGLIDVKVGYIGGSVEVNSPSPLSLSSLSLSADL